MPGISYVNFAVSEGAESLVQYF